MSTDEVQVQLEQTRIAVEQLAEDQALMSGVCKVGGAKTALLRPMLTNDGLRWVCAHETKHQTSVVATLAK